MLAVPNTMIVKHALLTLAHLQSKTGKVDFGINNDTLKNEYLRALAEAVKLSAQDTLSQEVLLYALSMVYKLYSETQQGRYALESHLGAHILDLLESSLVFSHNSAVATLAQELADTINGSDSMN